MWAYEYSVTEGALILHWTVAWLTLMDVKGKGLLNTLGWRSRSHTASKRSMPGHFLDAASRVIFLVHRSITSPKVS